LATRTGKPYCGLAVGSTPTRPTKLSHHCSSASASKTLCQALAEHMISALCRDEAFHKKGPAPFDVEPTPERQVSPVFRLCFHSFSSSVYRCALHMVSPVDPSRPEMLPRSLASAFAMVSPARPHVS